MANELGKKVWIIPDGFLPEKSNGDFVSHEAVCVLNTGDEEAKINLSIYFEDREPMDKFFAVCGARRTNHIRLDKIVDAEEIIVFETEGKAVDFIELTDVHDLGE